MGTKPVESHPKLAKNSGVALRDDVAAIRRASWLSPAANLEVVTGKLFGRAVQSYVQRIKDSRRPLALKLRNRFSAVIIDSESYEELLSLKAKYAELVERVKLSEVASAGDQFEAMFARISAPQTAAGFQSLRLATTEELAATYKPGATEGK